MPALHILFTIAASWTLTACLVGGLLAAALRSPRHPGAHACPGTHAHAHTHAHVHTHAHAASGNG